MPKIESASDATKLMGALFAGIAAGDIMPSEASEIASLIKAFVETLKDAQLNSGSRKSRRAC
jgi:hypothetical protein